MQQVADGKREAFSLLMRRHANPVLTFLARMTGNLDRAEELFQEVFLTLWLMRHKYDPAQPFRPWLFGIARMKCLHEFRQNYQSRTAAGSVLVEFNLDDGPGPVETAIATEDAKSVAAALARLPEQQRTVVSLRIWNGLSYRDIAEVIGSTEVTARSHMFHGLNSLRKVLEPRWSS